MSDPIESNDDNVKMDADLPDEVAAMFDLSLKKKKKKKTKITDESLYGDEKSSSADKSGASAVDSTGNSLNPYGFELDPPTYHYEQLLDRVVDFLTNKDPAWAEKRRQTVKTPQLSRVGSKKTVWTNFQEICKMMHRNPDHVFAFMLAELGTEGSIDGSQRLVIRGKFVAKVIAFSCLYLNIIIDICYVFCSILSLS